jgi:hypothetical protein
MQHQLRVSHGEKGKAEPFQPYTYRYSHAAAGKMIARQIFFKKPYRIQLDVNFN